MLILFSEIIIKKNMKHYPVILSIAGSDCSGGAGIQADIKTISALGGYAASVITAVTVQNTMGVHAVHAVPIEIIRGQIEAVMEDLHPEVVKIGMVGDAETVRAIAGCLQKYHPKYIVYDPVMVSTSGRKLMNDDAIEIVKGSFSISQPYHTQSGRSGGADRQDDNCPGGNATDSTGAFHSLPNCRIDKRRAFAGRRNAGYFMRGWQYFYL